MDDAELELLAPNDILQYRSSKTSAAHNPEMHTLAGTGAPIPLCVWCSLHAESKKSKGSKGLNELHGEGI